MSTQIINESCYTCENCSVNKKICRLHNKTIHFIFKDKCTSYTKRYMEKCEICGRYVVNLNTHIFQAHHKTLSEYNIITQLNETKKTKLHGKNLF